MPATPICPSLPAWPRTTPGRSRRTPSGWQSVERRRDLLSRLTGKYGATLEQVLATRDQAAGELDLLDTADTDLRALAARRSAAEGALRTAAGALSDRRRDAADRLARGVNRLLPQLGLPGGKLSVALASLAEIGAHGEENVQLNVQLNVGLEAKPLAKVASGGELSRLMLALKVVLVKHDAIATLVFDEVDQGIGGETGAQVGRPGRGGRAASGAGDHPPTADRRAGRWTPGGVKAGPRRHCDQRRAGAPW